MVFSQEIIYGILIVLLLLVIFIITKFVIPKLDKTIQAESNKDDSSSKVKVYQVIKDFIEKAIIYAEKFSDEMTGTDKKKFVKELVMKFIEDNKVDFMLSDRLLDCMIDAIFLILDRDNLVNVNRNNQENDCEVISAED